MRTKIYAASSEVEGNWIIGFLKENDIAADFMTANIQPGMKDTTQALSIWVLEDSKEKAIKLLKQAREDKVITDTGLFL